MTFPVALMCHFRTVRAPRAVRKHPACVAAGEELSLVTQTLLVPILPHTLAPLVLGDFGLAFFLKRTHRTAIQAFGILNCNLLLP